jgi:hypothetical protein
MNLTPLLHKVLGEELVEVHLHLHMTRCLIKHMKFYILNVIFFLREIMSLGKEEFCVSALKCHPDCLPDATSSQMDTQVDGHKLV